MGLAMFSNAAFFPLLLMYIYVSHIS